MITLQVAAIDFLINRFGVDRLLAGDLIGTSKHKKQCPRNGLNAWGKWSERKCSPGSSIGKLLGWARMVPPIEPSRPRFSDGLLIYDAQLSGLFRFPHAQHSLNFRSTNVRLGIGG